MRSILQILPLLAAVLGYSHSLSSSYFVKTDSHAISKRQAPGGDNIRITKLHVQSEIQFRYARTTVESYIKNFGSVAETTQFQAILPENAFVSNFSMIVGETEYVAEVKSKDEAKAEFDSQVEDGLGAGLVEQDARDANLFKIRTSIEPTEKVIFRLTYDELLERSLGLYEHTIHVQPGQIVDDFKIIVNINESLPITSLNVPELEKENEISPSSKTSSIATVTRDEEDNSKGSIVYKISKKYQKDAGKKGIQGAFKVQYDVDRTNQTNEVQVIDGYFVHFFTPENLKVLPKHIIFVLDISGSMGGEKLQQLKDAMFTILDEMTDNDFFDIITFSNGVSKWSPTADRKVALKSSKKNKKLGIDFVLGLNAGGGTNINSALLEGINLGKSVASQELLDKDTQSMILFLTDGQASSGVTGKQAILGNLKESNNDGRFPIFSLAFGRGADFDLIRDISKETGSRAKQIYEGSDAALQLEGFYQEISSPLLSDLTLNYVGDAIDQDHISNATLKTFFKGSTFVVAGKIPVVEDAGFEVDIKAKAGAEDYIKHINICLLRNTNTGARNPRPNCYFPTPSPPARSDAQNFLKSLYAYLTIKQLQQKDDESSSKRALNMALENNFVTKQTSLLVTKDNKEPVAADFSKISTYGNSNWNGGHSGIMLMSNHGVRSGSSNRRRFPARRVYNSPAGPAKFNGMGSQNMYMKMASAPSNPYGFESTPSYPNGFGFGSSNSNSFDLSVTTTTPSPTTTTTSGPCKLTLYSKTYNRGIEKTVVDSSADLGDFKDQAVSAVVTGDCCWTVFSETGFNGQSLRLSSSETYTSVLSLKDLRRNLKSVEKRTC